MKSNPEKGEPETSTSGEGEFMMGRDIFVRFVIARSGATKQSSAAWKAALDCFASLAMTESVT